MQKWEYLFLSLGYERDDWRPRYVNGAELKDWKKGPKVSEFANKLGEEGWELAAAPYTAAAPSPGDVVSTARLIFKRSKE